MAGQSKSPNGSEQPMGKAAAPCVPTSDSQNFQEDRTKFEDYIHGYEHEHELIDRKETWLLTSQTILFAALGLTLQAPTGILIQVIAWVGLALCVAIFIGLIGNILAKWFLYSDYKNAGRSADGAKEKTRWGTRGTSEVEFGVRTHLTMLGILTDILIPAAFAA